MSGTTRVAGRRAGILIGGWPSETAGLSGLARFPSRSTREFRYALVPHTITVLRRSSFPAANEQVARLKLVLAIIHDYDVDAVLRSLLGQGFSVTRIASAGGFLRTGNVTIMIGVEDDRVDLCIRLLATAGSRREIAAPSNGAFTYDDLTANGVVNVALGGASVFVLPVERFERIFAPAALASARR